MDRNDEIKELWKRGFTASGIATRMGISRNVVMGVVHRFRKNGQNMEKPAALALGETAEVILFPQKAPPKKVPRRAPPKSSVTLLSELKRPVKGVFITDLKEHHCRYVVGEMTFCGKRRKLSKSMCDEHYALCYVPSQPKKRRPQEARSFQLQKLNF
jgi:hypothetical protein